MGVDLMTPVHVADESFDWSGSALDLVVDGQQVTLEVPGVSMTRRSFALESLELALEDGDTIPRATERARSAALSLPAPTVHQMADDVMLLDASHVSQAYAATDVVKSVSVLCRGERRILLVAGVLDFSGDSDYDTVSAFGALMVRLNVSLVVAVGTLARSLYLSVGMEGSWDGESQFCADASTAYDEVRAHVRQGDVVLVLGSLEEPLTSLVTQLRSGLA